MKTQGGQTFDKLLDIFQENQRQKLIWFEWSKGKSAEVLDHKSMTNAIAKLRLEKTLTDIAETLSANFPNWLITITRTQIKKIPVREQLWPQLEPGVEFISLLTEPPTAAECSKAMRWALIIQRYPDKESKLSVPVSCGVLVTYKHMHNLEIQTSNYFNPGNGENAIWTLVQQFNGRDSMETVGKVLGETVFEYLCQKNLL